MSENSTQTEGSSSCPTCIKNATQLNNQTELLSQFEMERKELINLFSNATIDDTFVLIDYVKEMLRETSEMKIEVEKYKKEKTKMAESVGRQLLERDTTHSERIRSLEMKMEEKEKQMLQSSTLLKQQLAAVKKESHQLQRQLVQLESKRSLPAPECMEQEIESLRTVLDMRKVEAEQVKAANNSLNLELERMSGLGVELQVQKQKAEDMNGVINMKNDQLRQVLDEYDRVQQQLEEEVSAHLKCQQELEKNQWNKENFLLENKKKWKEISNLQRSDLILMDVVQKDKAVAYKLNC